MYTAADAGAPTPSDSEGDMDLSPDIEPDQDPSSGPEIESQEHQSGRQKAWNHFILQQSWPNCALVHLREALVEVWRA